jgi:peroxiredoxin
MKKLILASIAVITWASCSLDARKAKVTGTVKNMGNGEIYFIQSGDEKMIDTVKVTGDNFSFEKDLKEPTVFMVNFGAEQQPGFLILENGNTNVSYTMGDINSLHIEGGKEQGIYNSFLTMCKPVFSQMDSLGKVAMANESNAELMNSLQEEFFRLDGGLKQTQLKFIEENKSSIATAFIAVNYINEKMDKNYAEVDKIYNQLDDKVKASYYGKKLLELGSQLKGTSIGQPAPDFTLNDVNDKPISLSSYKGKITLVDFWASWCGPCRGENPNVVAAYNVYHNDGFEILGVSLDDNKAKWLDAIEKDKLTWTQVSDLQGWSSAAASLYGIQSIPSNVLIDKDGNILAKDLRGEALENKLKELFKK